MTWLVDLICYDTKAQELQEQHDTEDINVLFFEYLCNAYDSFMANDDEKYNFYDEELSETFQLRNDGKYTKRRRSTKCRLILIVEIIFNGALFFCCLLYLNHSFPTKSKTVVLNLFKTISL